MTDLLTRLQAAVGDSYRIEKELGGGGMSRVFLAEEVRLGRKVVIKVLPPEMGAGVNVERFEREIQLAAKLQHPHVVSLLTAGSSDDLLYYMMPFIEGESLRAKLAREGELPVAYAVKILKEVVDALAYAHRHKVVHRDIKPDNVLLSEGHAVVTDFGVAKAVSASTGESSLTSLGVALGTPAYMAPEQAVADPHVDHRADIYAVGAMAYEMLTGRPPFSGPNPQAVLSAHVTDAPEPATKHRTTVPDLLNALLMRCLEKKAADRWQKAEELIPHLDALLTPTGGITPTGTQPVAALDYEAAARRAHPVRVAALFSLASVGALAIVYLLMYQLGLPDWVFYGAIGLLVVGLPIMLLTGHHERRRAIARTTGMVATTPQEGLRRHFTWRKAILGGGLAFGGLAVVAATFMAMRLLGIGPVGTLVASGVLEERGLLIVAEFEDRTPEANLATSVTEAFRIDLSQSPVVRLMDASAIAQALRRMDREPGTTVDVAVAREIAEREGVQAVVAGDIGTLGRSYVVSARLITTADGSELVALRETAEDDATLVDAVDRLSAKLRERIGESLKTIRANPALSQVTTPALAALRRYSQALRADDEGDDEGAIAFLEEAVAIDTGFAMAYRKLGVLLSNRGVERARAVRALTKAFQHRDRLTERERYLTMGTYYSTVTFETDKAIAAYRALLDIRPDDAWALNNLALRYSAKRDYERAAEHLRLSYQADTTNALALGNLVGTQVNLGKLDEARATVEQLAEKFPNVPWVSEVFAAVAYIRDDYQGAVAELQSMRDRSASGYWRARGALSLNLLMAVRGKLRESERYYGQVSEFFGRAGLAGEYLAFVAARGILDANLRQAPTDALNRVEAALQRFPLDSIDPMERPYVDVAEFYAKAGRPDRARALLTEFENTLDVDLRRAAEAQRLGVLGSIALAEGRARDAIQEFTRADQQAGACRICRLPELGRAYELVGDVDSAVAVYERYVATPAPFRLFGDPVWRAGTYIRLGELYEERGESDKAIASYNRLVELWKDADEELQPVVREVRGRIARLVGER